MSVRKFIRDLWGNPFFWFSFAVVSVIRRLGSRQRHPLQKKMWTSLGSAVVFGKPLPSP